MLHRREVLAAVPLATFAAAFPKTVFAVPPAPVRFGLIADVHHDLMPDAPDRLAAFVDAMNEREIDFICQLGDFCVPKPQNEPFLNAFDRFPGERFHVLGNHDMDGGFSREAVVAFQKMPGRYHCFEKGGIRFVVLDGNDPGGKASGYKRFVAQDQLHWLAQELAAATEPTIVFIHQPIDGQKGGIENHAAVRNVLKAANADGPKVIAVFSGHHHQDYVEAIDGIHHMQINSASYHWIGSDYRHRSYDVETHKKYPYLESTCPYEKPLWAIVTVDRAAGTITVEGRSTEWVGGSPWEVGVTAETHDPNRIRPEISAQALRI